MPAVSTQNLGVILENTFLKLVRDLWRFRRYLPLSIAKTIATATNRLNYCNSLFHNIAIKDITKLCVQNFFARVVTLVSTFY